MPRSRSQRCLCTRPASRCFLRHTPLSLQPCSLLRSSQSLSFFRIQMPLLLPQPPDRCLLFSISSFSRPLSLNFLPAPSGTWLSNTHMIYLHVCLTNHHTTNQPVAKAIFQYFTFSILLLYTHTCPVTEFTITKNSARKKHFVFPDGISGYFLAAKCCKCQICVIDIQFRCQLKWGMHG